jgi:hypothetical protein
MELAKPGYFVSVGLVKYVIRDEGKPAADLILSVSFMVKRNIIWFGDNDRSSPECKVTR